MDFKFQENFDRVSPGNLGHPIPWVGKWGKGNGLLGKFKGQVLLTDEASATSTLYVSPLSILCLKRESPEDAASANVSRNFAYLLPGQRRQEP